jgi:hypothetical protein
VSAELGEEDDLLVEAVSLLVQRQRETEQWVTEQVCQAEERTAAAERRSVELEARLAVIEEQLARIARELEPGRAEGPGDGRLARLREQLESLKSGGDGRPEVSTPPLPRPPADASRAAAIPEVQESQRSDPRSEPRRQRLPPGDTVREHRSRIPIPPEWRQRAASPAVREPVGDGEAVRRRASFLDLLGSDPQDRFGLVFMGVGTVAVLYAALSLLRGA